MPVSAKAVRGHLRFWWRACHAHRYPSAEALFHDEAHLWGQTHRDGLQHAPSAIDVEVEFREDGRGTPIECVTWVWNDERQRFRPPCWGDYPGYALFPFQGTPPPSPFETDPESWPKPPRKPLNGVVFTLHLFWSADKGTAPPAATRRDIENAVRAWILFGGIGARTRRGCGTLWCAKSGDGQPERFRPSSTAPAETDAAAWTRVGPIWLPCYTLGAAAGTLPVPKLTGARAVVGAREARAVGAWNTAVELMASFRQTPDGREPGMPHPGMSYWPEPFSLRVAWPTLDRAHAGRTHPAAPSYPRADLGLPIIFQQMDRRDNPELDGALDGARRLASPVILKALPISESVFHPLVLLLDAPHVWDTGMPGVRRVWNGSPGASREQAVRPAELQPGPRPALRIDPKATMPAGRGARDGFMEYARARLRQRAVVSL